jgi:hypothetical protein
VRGVAIDQNDGRTKPQWAEVRAAKLHFAKRECSRRHYVVYAWFGEGLGRGLRAGTRHFFDL